MIRRGLTAEKPTAPAVYPGRYFSHERTAMLDTTTKPIITREDLKRMRALGLERYGRHDGERPRAWSNAGDIMLRIDEDLLVIPPILVQVGHLDGGFETIEKSYPTAREALDDLPRLRRIMDELREGAWSP